METIINSNIDSLSDEQKKLLAVDSKSVFYIKGLSASSLVWRGISAFLALVFAFAVALLIVLQARSRPDYMFTWYIFVPVCTLLVCFVIGFLWMLFDKLFAHFNKDKHYVIIDKDGLVLRNGKKASLLPWKDLHDYKITRRDADNYVTSIKLHADYENKDVVVEIPSLFADSMNRLDSLIYPHFKLNREDTADKASDQKEWSTVMGISLKNESLPGFVKDILRVKHEGALYLESKRSYFWRTFISLLCFLFVFGFVMTVLEILEITQFFAFNLAGFSWNFKIFLVVLLCVLGIGLLALIVINIVAMLNKRAQIFVVTDQGFVEVIHGIVYAIPWKSVKELTTKLYSYGMMNDMGKLKIQVGYSEKAAGKASKTYYVQGTYPIDTNKLLESMNKYWKRK